jgi:hypothetical protein
MQNGCQNFANTRKIIQEYLIALDRITVHLENALFSLPLLVAPAGIG